MQGIKTVGYPSKLFLSNMSLYIALSFVLIVFILGGGSRHDIASLIVLRPLSVIVVTYVTLVVTRAQIMQLYHVWLLAFVGTGMVAIHLVPLPPSIWLYLPNRELAEVVGTTVGIGQPWRPISLVPYRTHNALFSLFVPLAGLALMTILKPLHQYRVLPTLLVMGAISSIVGVLQLAGPNDGNFYFYDITNKNSAVGIFSNRNHQSIFLACCIPLLAVFLSDPNRTANANWKLFNACALFLGVLFMAIILVNGSRSGLFIGILSLVSIPILLGYGTIKQRFIEKRGLFIGIIFVAAALVILSTWLARSESVARVASFDKADELRIMVWPSIAEAAFKYFPIGSGFGTFEEVYKVFEPQDLLSLTYLNHAHNDWLEMFMSGGLVALLFMMVCVFGWAQAARTLFWHTGERTTKILYGRLGVVVTFLLGLASFADYPLRTPSLSLFFAISVGWMVHGVRRNI